MFYLFDTQKIIRRFTPRWFRSSERNVAFASVLVSGVRNIQALLQPVQDDIAAEYRYNGLVHSLERMLNDGWDAVQRRIYIVVPLQYPTLHCQDEADPPLAWMEDEEELSAYACENEEDGELYDFEFIIMVPNTLVFNPQNMLRKVELYRYAGRRPGIQLYNPGDGTPVGDPVYVPPLNG